MTGVPITAATRPRCETAASKGRSVDAFGEAADNRDSRSREFSGKLGCALPAGVGRFTGADNRYSGGLEQIEFAGIEDESVSARNSNCRFSSGARPILLSRSGKG
jgi:hypothetical protein